MLTELIATSGDVDLGELGIQAQTGRREIFPYAIVTYLLDGSDQVPESIWSEGQDLIEFVRTLDTSAGAVIPRCGPGLTAVDYLRMVAVCRLVHPSIHLQVDCGATGLKIGQLALSFGADDFGFLNAKPSLTVSEEEVRQKIREAGFHPKRRNATHSYYWLD